MEGRRLMKDPSRTEQNAIRQIPMGERLVHLAAIFEPSVADATDMDKKTVRFDAAAIGVSQILPKSDVL